MIRKLCLGSLLLCSLLLSSCAKDKANTVHVYNWTYYTPDSVIEAFEKETGYKVVVDNFSSNEEMFAKFTAGGAKGYDVVFPSADYTEIMIKLDMLQELDAEKLPNLSHLSALAREKAVYDPRFRYSVPYFIGAAGIAVNTKLAKEEYTRSWQIFADPQFASSMTLLDDMREVMGDALITLGYSNNTTDAEELRQAADLIEQEWKPNIIKFDAESFAKSFSRGEIAVVHCYPENVFEELPEEEWKDVDFFLPQEGGNLYIDNMVIPKEAKNREGALAFINFILRPEVYALFLDEFRFPPTTNEDAQAFTHTQPFFSSDQIENYSLLQDVGSALDLYNSSWQDLRYSK